MTNIIRIVGGLSAIASPFSLVRRAAVAATAMRAPIG